MALTVEEDTRGILNAAGVGTTVLTSDWGLHIGRSPKVPDRTITITKSGGLTSNPKWLLDEPSLQVMVRGKPNDYVAARDKIQAAKEALLGLPSQTIGTTRWTSVRAIGDTAFLGFDEEDRPMFSMNFSLIIEPDSGTNRDPL